MVRSLMWKEWMEQWRWLLLGCFIMVGFTAIGLQARVIEDALVLLVAAIIGAVVLPITIAMGLVAPEREAGTMPTLLRLPATPVLAYLVKTFVGAAAVIAPLLAAMAVAWWIAGNRELSSGYIVSRFMEIIPVAVAVMIWTMTLGIRQPSEARVGMVGVAFLLVCVVLAVALARAVIAMPDGRVLVFDATHWIHGLVPVRLIRSPAAGVWNINLYSWSPLQLALALAVWLIGAYLFRQPGRTRG